MTRVVLIHAGPTPWDLEDRVVGGHMLPLTPEAEAEIQQVIAALPTPPTAVYRDKTNEAADATAKMIARAFKLRPRHNADLAAPNLGLWQGLRREELRFRFPSVFPVWEKDPLTVHPPEGESLPEAVARLDAAVHKILRQARGITFAIALRPMSMQIVSGLLHGEPIETIAEHLHKIDAAETIELSN